MISNTYAISVYRDDSKCFHMFWWFTKKKNICTTRVTKGRKKTYVICQRYRGKLTLQGYQRALTNKMENPWRTDVGPNHGWFVIMVFTIGMRRNAYLVGSMKMWGILSLSITRSIMHYRPSTTASISLFLFCTYNWLQQLSLAYIFWWSDGYAKVELP